MLRSNSDSAETGNPMPCVIHGSYRRHLGEIEEAAAHLRDAGVQVLHPVSTAISREVDGFVLFDGQEAKQPEAIEAEFLSDVLALRATAGFSLWVNPDGYVGKSAAYEYGIAQACGVPAFFTESPADVPFYVPPQRIMPASDLAAIIRETGSLPELTQEAGPLAEQWQQLMFPTATVAVGGIVQYRDRLLLVQDGRWGDRLTIPGTTVRPGETRDAALKRLAERKFGITPLNVSGLVTSFMQQDSGYSKGVDSVVFDDRTIMLTSEVTAPKPGIALHWLDRDEMTAEIAAGRVEPNAAATYAVFDQAA